MPVAHAAQGEAVGWLSPSLDALRSRNEYAANGFTEFSIRSAGPLPFAADGFWYEVFVNDRRVQFDGLPAIYRAEPIPAGGPVELTFGLQNLDFSGADGGCDSVRVEIGFTSDAAPREERLSITRDYVALRDAGAVAQEAFGTRWTWDGTYRAARAERETEVFLASVEDTRATLDDLARRGYHEKLQALRMRANRLKQAVDELDLTFEGQPVIAVIRPPLTKVSWGVAAGLVRSTGQVEFLFSNEEADRLLSRLKDGRDGGSSAYRSAIRADIFLYPVKGGTTTGAWRHACSSPA